MGVWVDASGPLRPMSGLRALTLIVTGILELMPVRRSACTAGIGFLQHQPRLTCTGPLGWHFKLLLSWSNSKLPTIKISFASHMFIMTSPFSHWSHGKHPLMRQKRAKFLQISQLGHCPHSCRGVRSSKGEWDPRSGVEPLLLAATCC